jgi:hypothetical protein
VVQLSWVDNLYGKEMLSVHLLQHNSILVPHELLLLLLVLLLQVPDQV